VLGATVGDGGGSGGVLCVQPPSRQAPAIRISSSLPQRCARTVRVCRIAGPSRDDFDVPDPAHDDFKKFAIPQLSVDEDGNTNGAMAFDIGV
jgi:hypothetical protein